MFRLLSFTIYEHPLLAEKTFALCNPEEDNITNYYSVIIGPNGTGKSNLLGFILDTFNGLALIKLDEKHKLKGRFLLVYKLDNDVFNINRKSRQLICLKNGQSIQPRQLKLPAKWLASSVTINDKYPLLNSFQKLRIPEYKYLGIRSASNNAFISRITTNTVLYFIDALSKSKSATLSKIYKSLSLSPEVEIIFSGGPRLKLEKKNGQFVIPTSPEEIIDPHRTFLKKIKAQTSYRSDTYKKYFKEKEAISDVFNFVSHNSSIFEQPTKDRIQLRYSINLGDERDIRKVLDDWPILSIMLELELIKISKFLVTKDTAFRYEEASSGEGHLLTSLHGIAANLENNSLVIIDEPEVSLRPNWQVDYLEILKSLINSCKGVNVIISTHSHLLVSNLKNNESRITSLKRDPQNGKIEVDELDFETFGWDPESVLYNIFHVVSARNKYFELDLRKLISLISRKSENIGEIRRLIEKLEVYIVDNKDDPLNLVIGQSKAYIENK